MRDEFAALNLRELARLSFACPVVLAWVAPLAVHAQQLDPPAFAPNPTGASPAIADRFASTGLALMPAGGEI
jgi:hypothetical protein